MTPDRFDFNRFYDTPTDAEQLLDCADVLKVNVMRGPKGAYVCFQLEGSSGIAPDTDDDGDVATLEPANMELFQRLLAKFVENT